MRSLFLAGIAVAFALPAGANVIWTEDFSTDGFGVRYTGDAEFYNSATDHWGRRTNADIDTTESPYTGFSGTHFFTGEDLDDGGTSDFRHLKFSGIDISDGETLTVSFKLANRVITGYEANDYLFFAYSVDSGPWTTGVAFTLGAGGVMRRINSPANPASEPISEAVANAAFGTTVDGDGGTFASYALGDYSFSVPDGAALDLIFGAHLDGGGEEFALDDIEVSAVTLIPVELDMFLVE